VKSPMRHSGQRSDKILFERTSVFIVRWIYGRDDNGLPPDSPNEDCIRANYADGQFERVEATGAQSLNRRQVRPERENGKPARALLALDSITTPRSQEYFGGLNLRWTVSQSPTPKTRPRMSATSSLVVSHWAWWAPSSWRSSVSGLEIVEHRSFSIWLRGIVYGLSDRWYRRNSGQQKYEQLTLW
jgi:hypothetical protein